jgi:aminoglycoside phosphotransferase (APT) family kinase protein
LWATNAARAGATDGESGTAASRRAYRDALGVDEATWERGRGWAIVQAIRALPYYVDSNPAMADNARRTLAAVLE